MEIRFLADCNLGTLAKWLRILGYDTHYERGAADLEFLRKAQAENRIALTRKRDLAGRGRGVQRLWVKSDKAPAQLKEVLEALKITPDPSRRMTLCLRCNAPLQTIPKETAEGLVPNYVYQAFDHLHRCPLCQKIYWPGTHRERIEERLRIQMPGLWPGS